MAPRSSKRKRRRAGDTSKFLGWIAVGGMAAVTLAAIAIFHGREAPSAPRSSTVAETASAPRIAEASHEQVPPAADATAPAAVKMSARQWQSLDKLFARQLSRCWSAPAETEARPFVAKIRVEFSPDGALLGKPTLINPPTDPALKAQAAVAMKAVTGCKQLNIPASFGPYYAEWRSRIINFDPTL